MAYSYTDYSGNGALTQFTVPFGYLDKAHVTVTVGGLSAVFTWLNDTTAVITNVPATGTNNIRIRRTTPIATLRQTFVDGSTLTQDQLNQQSKQELYALQEEADLIALGVFINSAPAYDAVSRQLPIPTANKVLAWDSGATAIINQDPGSVGLAVPASQSVDQSKLAVDVQYQVDTMAALKALTTKYNTVLVRGYYAIGDGGGGIFRWNSVDTTTDNGGTFIIPNSGGTGRWNRIYSNNIDVRWFGAKGDGTTDDTIALQASINTAVRRVYFPSGTYRLGAAGLTGVSQQLWIGDGRERTIVKMGIAPTADMIYFAGRANSRIEGITFDGNELLTGATSAFSPAVLPCIYIVNGNDIDIVGCGFKGFKTCGLMVNVCYRILIADNLVVRLGVLTTENYGIVISGNVGNESYWVTIRGNKCQFCQISTNCHDSTITENIVTGWGFSAGINTQAHPISYNLVISNNICFNSNQAFDSSPYRPAGIENWALYTTITGNICYGNYGEGIDLGGSNCTVTGNVCYNNSGYGIYSLYQSASYNANNSLIAGNQLFDTRAGGARTQLAGYAEQGGGLTGVIFQGNIARNNIGSNIYNATSRNTSAQYDWVAPTLVGSWVNYGGGIGANAGYYKDPEGIVHLKGLVKLGAVPGIIFTLPTGFRPSDPLYFPTVANGAYGMLTIDAGGAVTAQNGSAAYFSLDSISFRAT